MKQFILFAVIVISICACVSIHSNFTYYKEKPFIRSSKSLHINGIYFITNPRQDHPSGYIFLYKDGSAYVSTPIPMCCKADSVFWSNPKEGYRGLHQLSDRWGYYIIRNDSIFIQYFHLNYDYWMKRNTSELRGIIKNDSTILITKELCSWCHTLHPSYYSKTGINEFSPAFEYHFFPLTNKPDSTEAWYKQQSWYKEWQEEQNKQAPARRQVF